MSRPGRLLLLRWGCLPWGCMVCCACGGASVEGGEVRPLGAGMRRVSAMSTTECHAQPADGGGRELKRGSQVEIWDTGSKGKPARVLVERIEDHQALQVHRSFSVPSGVQYEVVLHPASGPPLLQRYLVRSRPGADRVQGSLEVVRDFSVDAGQRSRGGRVVLRCQLVANP